MFLSMRFVIINEVTRGVILFIFFFYGVYVGRNQCAKPVCYLFREENSSHENLVSKFDLYRRLKRVEYSIVGGILS